MISLSSKPSCRITLFWAIESTGPGEQGAAPVTRLLHCGKDPRGGAFFLGFRITGKERSVITDLRTSSNFSSRDLAPGLREEPCKMNSVVVPTWCRA